MLPGLLVLFALAGLVPVATSTASAAACGTVILPPAVGQGAASAVTSLNWLLTNSVSNVEAINQIYRPLVWLDRNLDYDPSMSLANSVVTIDGGRTWRLALKPWLWSDGVAVTAKDVVFTFDLVRRIGPAFVGYDVGGIPNLLDRVVAVSPREVEIRLTKRVNPAWFLRLGLGGFKPLPEHVYRGMDVRAMRARLSDPSLYAVSDGPFLLKDWTISRNLTLAPNPRFGGAQPRVRRLVMDFLEGGNPLQSLRAGEIDAANVPYRLWDLATSLPGFHTEAMDSPYGLGSIILNFRSRPRAVPARRARAPGDRRRDRPEADQRAGVPRPGPGDPRTGACGDDQIPFATGQGRLRRPGIQPGACPRPARPGRLEAETGRGACPERRAPRLRRRGSPPEEATCCLRCRSSSATCARSASTCRCARSSSANCSPPWRATATIGTASCSSGRSPAFPTAPSSSPATAPANYGHYHDARMDALNRAVVSEPGLQALYAA